MAKLVCRAGPNAGHEYPLDKDKVVFGRRSGIDVQIVDSMASREHFVVHRDGRLYTVSDLESRNGTKVNGRKITERQLEFGDVIAVGEVEWILVKEEGDVEIRDLLTSKYEIVEKIGEGGMGIVYKAVQRSMDRTVALKILSPKYAARPKFVNQFIEEARAAGRLNHPHIIQVHDVDTENGIHYFSMEYIEGATCMQLLRTRGPFPVGEALEIARLTAKALQYAHEQRIIHRDVKPDNIMVGMGGTVKLADLGISKTFEEAEAEGEVKRIVGTPHYMAPEAAMGKRIDHRVDIYSLGATLYQLLTAHTLFPNQGASELLKSQIKKVPKAARDINPAIPEAVESLLTKLLAKDPDERCPSAQDAVRAIETLQQQAGLAPELPSSGETQMLRRFASGKMGQEGNPGDPKLDKQPTRAGTTRAAPQPTRGRERIGTGRTSDQFPSRRGGGTGPLKALLLLILLGLVAVLVWRMQPQKKVSQPGPGTVLAGTDQTAPPTQPGPGAGPGQAPPDPQASLRQRLADLTSRLNRASNDATIAALRGELDRLGVEAGPALAAQVEMLRSRIDERQAALRVGGDPQGLRQLQQEVDRMEEAADHDGALDRVAGFREQAPAELHVQLDELAERLRKEKQTHVAKLASQLGLLKGRKDAAGLRALKAGLPESLLDDPIAADIQAAINGVDDALFSRHQAIVTQASKDLIAWRLDRVIASAEEHVSAIGAQALRERLQGLAATAQVLQGLPAAVQQGVVRHGGGIKLREPVQNMAKAVLQGADADGLRLGVGGGTATAAWAQLSRAEFNQVHAAAAGAMSAELSAALDAYFAARAAP